MTIYQLTSENLTSLGGPQGQEYTTVNWTRCFTSVEKAKYHAEQDYRRQGGEAITWRRTGNCQSSGDLRWVMYLIRPIRVY